MTINEFELRTLHDSGSFESREKLTDLALKNCGLL
jgi:hypothetical protein